MYLQPTRAVRRAHVHATRTMPCGHIQFIEVMADPRQHRCAHCLAA